MLRQAGVKIFKVTEITLRRQATKHAIEMTRTAIQEAVRAC
jgi:biotin operon repressor